jgi:hypothetical protein
MLDVRNYYLNLFLYLKQSCKYYCLMFLLINDLLPIEVGVIEYKDNKIVFINFAILLLFCVLRFYIILNDGVYMLA